MDYLCGFAFGAVMSLWWPCGFERKARLEEHLRQHNAKRVATAPETSERKIMMKTFSLPWNK
ncbi:unnamed protein product [Brassica oleracea]